MADLIAQGAEISQRWRRTLPVDKPVIIGRESGAWSTPWDDRVSREHARICWDGKRLAVERIESARNPVFLQGRQVEQFQLASGEHFVIGNTSFTLSADRMRVTLDAPRPDREQSFSAAELKRIAFRHANERIEILSRLPDVIKGAASDNELYVRLINLVLSGVPRADAAALVVADGGAANVPARVLHWDRRWLAAGDFQPSQRLINQAVARRESVMHTWTTSNPAPTVDFTMSESIDWAFCTPLPGEACRGWALYLAGRFGSSTPEGMDYDPTDLRDDVKFTELAAATLSSLRELRRLGRQQAGLAQFFAPVVMEALATDDPEKVLAPRETEVAVLFCDLRGFSRTSERAARDLMGLLERVSRALGVMTHQILDHGGVVGDFHGDAAMGFWGWPLGEPRATERAALAALGIQAQFEAAARQSNHPLADFRVGIGIATGNAVAGKIGTADQVKVTVFGPVVNLAARLESMTRHLHASVLLDSDTAVSLVRTMPATVGRVRRLAVVQPYGLERSVEIHELLPPAEECLDDTERSLRNYDAALTAFIAGDWPQAREIFDRVSPKDRAKEFLTAFMKQNGGAPRRAGAALCR